jgi:murein DD-endopeptidase MepM/ murein hydrolase activator NlpD
MGRSGRESTVELQDAYDVRVQPSRVFKRPPDMNRSQVEGWSFTLAVVSSEPRTLELDSLALDYQAQDVSRARVEYPRAALSAMNLFARQPTPPRAPFPILGLIVSESLPIALAIDRASLELRARDTAGNPVVLRRSIPLEVFTQKTTLVFPFRGRGMITQGGALNDGHRNRSGMFAVDAIALSDRYAAMNDEGDALTSYAGWGRPIIAPAAGTVVAVRSDRPDQPVPGTSDARYFAPEYATGGDPANHVVIDHGNGEFSMIAHMQAGSIRLRNGDRVEQGQELGLLGNSGDSTSPHVHHQLMSGPQWTTADAFPHSYLNGPGKNHDRGAMFNAK